MTQQDYKKIKIQSQLDISNNLFVSAIVPVIILTFETSQLTKIFTLIAIAVILLYAIILKQSAMKKFHKLVIQESKINKEISLLILIETKDGQRQKQIDAFNKLAPIVLNETGCLEYELKEVQDNENEFVLVEKWASKEDLSAHDITSHMIEADKISPTFRAKPATVIILNNITS